MAPQIIMVCLWFVSLLITSYLHGKPKTDKHNIFRQDNVMDSSLLNIQKKKIIDQVFHEYYLSNDPLFIQMINTFCLKSDQVLRDYVDQIIKVVNLKINKDSFFHFLSEECYDEKLISSYIADYYQQTLAAFRELRNMSESLSDAEDSNTICDVLDQLIDAKNYDNLFDLLDVLSLPKQKVNYPEEDKPLRGYIAETFSILKKASLRSPGRYLEKLHCL